MATDAWDVYVTDNGKMVVEMLNGVSALVYGNSLQFLVMGVLTLGLALITIRYLFTGGWSGSLQWFLTSVFIFFGLVVPKQPVFVQDYSDPTFAAGIVQDVPLGLAATLSFSTTVGDRLVQLYETVFGTIAGAGASANSGFQYSTGGMLKAEATFEQIMTTDAQDPRVIANTNQFFKFCVYPKMVKNEDFAELQSQGDFDAFIRAPKGNASMFFKPVTGAGIWRTCNDVRGDIADDINAESIRVSGNSAKLQYPTFADAAANAAFDVDADFVAERFLGLSMDGPEMINQVMAINMIKRSMNSEAASVGDSALLDFVNAQAQVQSRLTMSSIGALMQSALPKMHSVLLIVLVALFPLIFILAMLPNGGGGILKNYFLFYLNLQVWPLMFAVFSRIIEGETIERAKAIVSTTKGGVKHIDMTVLDSLASLPSETSAIAAMMIGLIPGIAVMISSGYKAVASQVQSTLRPFSVATENAANAGATGNINLKNPNIANSNIRNHTADQTRLSPHTDVGQASGYTANGAAWHRGRNGRMRVDGRGVQGSMAMSGSASKIAEDTYTSRSNRAKNEVLSNNEAYGKSMSMAATDVFAASYGDQNGHSFEDSLGYDISASDKQSASRTLQDVMRFAENSDMGVAKELRDYFNKSAKGTASAGFKVFGTGGSVEGSTATGQDRSLSEKAQKTISEYFAADENSAQAREFSDVLSSIKGKKDRINMGNTSSLSKSLNANLSNAEDYRKASTKASNEIASLDNAYGQTSGHRSSINASLDGRATDIINEKYKPEHAAEILSATPSNLEAMGIQRAAFEQAFNEQMDTGGYVRNAQNQMSLGDVENITGGETNVRKGHADAKNAVEDFSENNQALEHYQKVALQTRDQMQVHNDKRWNESDQLRQKVIAGHGGVDASDGNSNFQGLYEETRPAVLAEKIEAAEQARNEFMAQQPTEKVDIPWHKRGHFMGGRPSSYNKKVEPTDEQEASFVPDVTVGIRDQVLQNRQGSSAEPVPQQNSTGLFNVEGSNVIDLHTKGGGRAHPATDAVEGTMLHPKYFETIGAQNTSKNEPAEAANPPAFQRSRQRQSGPAVRPKGKMDGADRFKKGEFEKANTAVMAAVAPVLQTSISKDVEYGGLIYRMPDGQIEATPAIEGKAANLDGSLSFDPNSALPHVPIDRGAVVLGDYHTHGGDSGNHASGHHDEFSHEDIIGINESGRESETYAGGWLIDPDGQVSFYEQGRIPDGQISDVQIEANSIEVGQIAVDRTGPNNSNAPVERKSSEDLNDIVSKWEKGNETPGSLSPVSLDEKNQSAWTAGAQFTPIPDNTDKVLAALNPDRAYRGRSTLEQRAEALASANNPAGVLNGLRRGIGVQGFLNYDYGTNIASAEERGEIMRFFGENDHLLKQDERRHIDSMPFAEQLPYNMARRGGTGPGASNSDLTGRDNAAEKLAKAINRVAFEDGKTRGRKLFKLGEKLNKSRINDPESFYSTFASLSPAESYVASQAIGNVMQAERYKQTPGGDEFLKPQSKNRDWYTNYGIGRILGHDPYAAAQRASSVLNGLDATEADVTGQRIARSTKKFNIDHPNHHEYGATSLYCKIGPGCSLESVETIVVENTPPQLLCQISEDSTCKGVGDHNLFSGIKFREKDVPQDDNPVNLDNYEGVLLFENPIETWAHPDSFSSGNTTKKGHMFHPGDAVFSAFEFDGHIAGHTLGNGDAGGKGWFGKANGEFNNFVGPPIMKMTQATIRGELQNSSAGEHPIIPINETYNPEDAANNITQALAGENSPAGDMMRDDFRQHFGYKSEKAYLKNLGEEFHDLKHSDPQNFSDTLNLLPDDLQRDVNAAVSTAASFAHNDSTAQNSFTKGTIKNARFMTGLAVNSEAISDTAFEVLTDFRSGEGQRNHHYAIQADNIEDALRGLGTGDTEVFDEMFNTGGGIYYRKLFGGAVQGYAARENYMIENGAEDYVGYTAGGTNFDWEAIPGLADGIDIGDVVGTMSSGINVEARGDNLTITGVNTTGLESYAAGNLISKIGLDSPVNSPPDGNAFSDITQSFEITVPNPYLAPTYSNPSTSAPLSAGELRENFFANTEGMNSELRDKVVSARISDFLEHNKSDESKIIKGEDSHVAKQLSEALFNGMDLTRLAETSVTLGDAERLFNDRDYRNDEAARVFSEGTQADIEFFHYDLRKALNDGPPGATTPESLSEMLALFGGDLETYSGDWAPMDYDESILHQNEDGVEDFKFVHKDGREVVYNGVGGEIIDEAEFVGTFNYNNAGSRKDDTRHMRLDVIPWLKMGNSRDDTTTFEDRLNMLTEPQLVKLGQLVNGPIDKLDQGAQALEDSAKGHIQQLYDLILDQYEPLMQFGPEDPTPWR